MKTLADLKRRMTVGLAVTVVNHIHPDLSGERTVLAAQSRDWCLSFPSGHPKRDVCGGSWLRVPKAGDCTFVGDVVTIHCEGVPFVTLTFPTTNGCSGGADTLTRDDIDWALLKH